MINAHFIINRQEKQNKTKQRTKTKSKNMQTFQSQIHHQYKDWKFEKEGIQLIMKENNIETKRNNKDNAQRGQTKLDIK